MTAMMEDARAPSAHARARQVPVCELDAHVLDRHCLAQGVIGLTLGLPDGRRMTWGPGDHIDVEVPGLGYRQYSLCGPADDPARVMVAVLLEEPSRGGSAYVHSLVEGELVRIRGPRANFPLIPAQTYRFIAGGIGITPILAMVREAERSGTPWTLLYGGRSRESMAFTAELAQYGERVRILPEDEFGRLPVREWLAYPEPGTLVYCCGPEGLLDAAKEACYAWPPDSLHVERFRPRKAGPPVAEEPFHVELARTGAVVLVEPGTSILEAVAAAGIPTLSACHEGTCGTCETAVLDGVPEHRDAVLDEQDRAANEYMMICVSRSLTSRLVLDL